jgi:hypothetical protein
VEQQVGELAALLHEVVARPRTFSSKPVVPSTSDSPIPESLKLRV